jgi:excisionase family DNA binding protein
MELETLASNAADALDWSADFVEKSCAGGDSGSVGAEAAALRLLASALRTEAKRSTSSPSFDLVDVGEACVILGVSRKTMSRLLDAGEVQGFQVAGRGPLKFRREDLAGLLKPARGGEK